MKSGTRAGLRKCKRVLIKIGSQVLNTGHGLNNRVIERICDDVGLLMDKGKEFAIVSSGAIAEGTAIMRIPDKKTALSKKQALAAIGQGSLMRAYTDAFRRYGYTAAQILITREDLDNRRRYLNIRNTFSSLFELGAIPIINENDTVSVDEIQFTDNDMLAAMIVPLVEPHIMIILTDIEGLFSRDPKVHTDANIIHDIPELKPKDLKALSDDANPFGRGASSQSFRPPTGRLCWEFPQSSHLPTYPKSSARYSTVRISAPLSIRRKRPCSPRRITGSVLCPVLKARSS